MRPPAPASHPPSATLLALATGLWMTAALGGFSVLLRYAGTAGAATVPTTQWPAGAGVVRAAGQPTLLLFLHPQCPCSRASLGELTRLLTAVHDRVQTVVVIAVDDTRAEPPEAGAFWQEAARLPGVQVLADPDGRLAREFHPATSGGTLLYAADGRLLFTGGITAARGHLGDNTGRAALEALLTGQRPPATVTPVFGCPLDGPENPPPAT